MYLRPYRADDLPALYAMDVRCFAPRFRFTLSMMRSLAEAPTSLVQLACEVDGDDERLLGFCAVTLEISKTGLAGYIATLDVAPEQRRRGIGLFLLQWAETACHERGADRLDLHVWSGNRAALGLYERAGYRQMGLLRGFYGRHFDALLYTRALR